jgi:hypothetical protein
VREFGVESRRRVSPSSHRSVRPPRAQADRLGLARRRRADEPTWSRAADSIKRLPQVHRGAGMPSHAWASHPRDRLRKQTRSPACTRPSPTMSLIDAVVQPHLCPARRL